MFGEGKALGRADSGRIFPEQLQEHFFLVVYLDHTTVTDTARAPAATDSTTIENRLRKPDTGRVESSQGRIA